MYIDVECECEGCKIIVNPASMKLLTAVFIHELSIEGNNYNHESKFMNDIGRVHVKKPVEKISGLNRWLVKINHWLEKN